MNTYHGEVSGVRCSEGLGDPAPVGNRASVAGGLPVAARTNPARGLVPPERCPFPWRYVDCTQTWNLPRGMRYVWLMARNGSFVLDNPIRLDVAETIIAATELVTDA